jgi:hypothetical protein
VRRSGWFVIAVFVVVSSMLMWACGGGGKEEPGAATEPVATSPAGETAEAGTTPQSGGDTAEFEALASQFKNATYKVTYKISTTPATAGMEGTMTWYKKGDSLRMDFSSEADGQQMNAIVIERPDQSYLCTNAPDTGEAATCFSTPVEPGRGVEQIISGLEETLADPTVEIAHTETREIVGEAVECFTMRSSESAGESEVCFSRDGVPLLSRETVDQGEMVLEATDFSLDVSDGDFEPPYPVSEDVPSASDQGQ